MKALARAARNWLSPLLLVTLAVIAIVSGGPVNQAAFAAAAMIYCSEGLRRPRMSKERGTKPPKRWTVAEGPTHLVVRFPWWIPSSVMERAAQNICSDAALVGRHITYKIGHRYLRFDGEVRSG